MKVRSGLLWPAPTVSRFQEPLTEFIELGAFLAELPA